VRGCRGGRDLNELFERARPVGRNWPTVRLQLALDRGQQKQRKFRFSRRRKGLESSNVFKNIYLDMPCCDNMRKSPSTFTSRMARSCRTDTTPASTQNTHTRYKVTTQTQFITSLHNTSQNTRVPYARCASANNAKNSAQSDTINATFQK